MNTILGFFILAALGLKAHATEFQVATNGNDTNPGTPQAPFRTIQRAAEAAQPGDIILIHQGVYRERVSPPRGGASDTRRIVYEAAPGEKVEIKGSEVVRGWVIVQGAVWKVTLPDSFFGKFNPYGDLIHGDWYNPMGRQRHTGCVYLNGRALAEAINLEGLLHPGPVSKRPSSPLWFARVDGTNTTIWAQFPGAIPNEQLVEINVRQTVFYPKKTGINYITVRGFTMSQAATPWAPPTAEQIGLIGTHWSKGWIIESNDISYSACAGISLGKYGDAWDNRAESAEGYIGTIHRALAHGWNRLDIGHHIVRDNVISHCGQAGIVGSLGCAFSTVTGNVIHDIDVPTRLNGAEMAGIKFHGAVDVIIRHNHIYRCVRGIWLDWMAQGTRVTGNLLHNNQTSEDLFVEVDHGPFLVDNNLFLSPHALLDNSQGGAYVHNLFLGTISEIQGERRQTPYLKPHSTMVAALHGNPTGDDRFYNNIFGGGPVSLRVYDKARLPMFMDGNVFLDGAKPSKWERTPLIEPDAAAGIEFTALPAGYFLKLKEDPAWSQERHRKLITSQRLGSALISGERFENPDGSPLRIDTDYFGHHRDARNPFPGPFENPATGPKPLRVW